MEKFYSLEAMLLAILWLVVEVLCLIALLVVTHGIYEYHSISLSYLMLSILNTSSDINIKHSAFLCIFQVDFYPISSILLDTDRMVLGLFMHGAETG